MLAYIAPHQRLTDRQNTHNRPLSQTWQDHLLLMHPQVLLVCQHFYSHYQALAKSEGSTLATHSIEDAINNPNRSIPEYLAFDAATKSAKLLEWPSMTQISWPIEIDMHEVCDFLAHAQ